MKTSNQNSKTHIKSKFRHKIARPLNLFQIFQFWFQYFQFWSTFFSLLQGFSKCTCISNFFCHYFPIVWTLFLAGFILSWSNSITLKEHFLMNPSHVNIYFVKSFLKSHSFQEARASWTNSCETNRADKIVLNIFGVAM